MPTDWLNSLLKRSNENFSQLSEPYPPSLPPPQVHHLHQLSPFSPTLTSPPEGCSVQLQNYNPGIKGWPGGGNY